MLAGFQFICLDDMAQNIMKIDNASPGAIYEYFMTHDEQIVYIIDGLNLYGVVSFSDLLR